MVYVTHIPRADTIPPLDTPIGIPNADVLCTEVDPEFAPWSVKAMRISTRKLAIACASNERLTVAEWVERAIFNQRRLDQGNEVLPPMAERIGAVPGIALDRYKSAFPDRDAELTGLAAHIGPYLPTIDMTGLANMLNILADISNLANMKMPRSTVNQAHATVRAHMRDARGLPPLKSTRQRLLAGPAPVSDLGS